MVAFPIKISGNGKSENIILSLLKGENFRVFQRKSKQGIDYA